MISKIRSIKRGLRMLGLSLIAVGAVGALGASAAAASSPPQWMVDGAYLGAGQTKAFTATNTSPLVLKTASITFTAPTSSCTQTGEIEGSSFAGPGTKKNVVLSCQNFAVEGAKACVVNTAGAEGGTVTTNSLKSTLVWLNQTGEAAGDLLEPTSGTSWATLVVSGCALANKYPLENAVLDELSTGESTTGQIDLPSTPILSYYDNESTRAKQSVTQLKLKAAKATLSGKFAYSLAGGEAVAVASPPPPALPPLGISPRWNVAGKFLASTETRTFTATNAKSLLLGIGAYTFEMPTCTQSGKIVGSDPERPGAEKEVTLSCTGVTAASVPTCQIRSTGQPWGTIVTEPLSSKLVWLSSNSTARAGEVLSSKSVLTTVETTGCSGISGPINGDLIVEMTPVEISETTATLSLPSPMLTKYWEYPESKSSCEAAKGVFLANGRCELTGQSLKLGSTLLSVTLSGSMSSSLNSGALFGVFAG
ncbi:MAG TPA: hypothetical protein VI039_01690 [Solirubrobacterales bacterium]